MRTCDVLVAGGGSAGLAAAVSAARAGARTLLVERGGMLGGMAPAALVHSICGLYRLPQGDAPPAWANPGFAVEFAQRLIRAGGAVEPVRMGRVDVLPQHPTAFACVADALVRETPRLEVLLHSEIVAASAKGEASLICRGREFEVRASTMIDATGDGALATLLGAPFAQETPERLQRPAFIFGLAGVDTVDFGDERRLRLAGRIATAVTAGELPAGALGAAFRATGWPGEVFVTIDFAGDAAFDPTDPASLSALEMEGRALASELTAFLARNAAGFAASFISAFPSRIGVRESRRVEGLYRLETDDLLRGATFDDAVALATWPMELRETNRGPRLRFPTNGQPCEIPLRSLRFRDLDRCFVAGRCISCSHEAQASIRVIGTCLATGEAAGFAAASLALHGKASAERVRALRELGLHEARRK
jgi:hypothetical protein